MLSGFAALRAPHPSSPARRGGAKQIEAQRPAAFRAFSVQGLTGAGLPTALYEKSPAQSAELQLVCGERGIRTPGPVKINGFQDRRIRPLCHLSKVEFYFARFIFSVKWIAKVRIFLEKTRGWQEKIRKFRNFEKICGERGIRTPNPER